MRGEISGRFPVDLLIVIFSISLDIVGQGHLGSSRFLSKSKKIEEITIWMLVHK